MTRPRLVTLLLVTLTASLISLAAPWISVFTLSRIRLVVTVTIAIIALVTAFATTGLAITVNGADDYFIPQSDTSVFEGRPKTEVHLLAGTGHCAFSKLPEVMSLVMNWLPSQIDGRVAQR